MQIQQQPPATADDTEQSKKVSFTLPPFHQNKDSTTWRAIPRRLKISTARLKWENSKYRRRTIKRPLTPREIKAAVLDGTIPSGISDTGATSSTGKPGDPSIHTDTPSNKVFTCPQEALQKQQHKQNYFIEYKNLQEQLAWYLV